MSFQSELRNFAVPRTDTDAFVFISPPAVSEGTRTERNWPWDSSPSQLSSDPAPVIQEEPPSCLNTL